MDLPEKQTNHPVIHLRSRSNIISYPGLHTSENEDYALAFVPENLEDYRLNGCLFIVADGSTGQAPGENASRYAANQVLDNYYAAGVIPPGDRLRMALYDVNRDLYERSKAADFDCGTTTLVAAVVHQNTLTVASVGNSRAYLIHDGQAQRITRDHDLISEILQMDTLSVEEIGRAGEQNRLTRSLGMRPDVEVDVFTDIPLYPGDVLLLCSDGLTRYVDDGQIALLAGTGNPMQDCRRLVNWAKEAGGEDDITALVVVVEQENTSKDARTIPGKTSLEPEISSTPEFQATDGGYSHKQQPVIRQWIILALVAGGFILLALIGMKMVGKTPEVKQLEQPLKAATPHLTLVFTERAHLQVSQTARIDLTNTPAGMERQAGPSPSATLPGTSCVWRVEQGQSLFSIIRRFDLEYRAEDTYFYFEECVPEQAVCAGEKIQIESHASILSGWFIFIPVDSIEACERGGGIWVQISTVH